MYGVMKKDLPSKQCIADDELALYFDGRLASSRQREIEEHLAVCPLCVARGRKIQASLSLWDNLSASNHGAAYLRDKARNALAALSAKSQPEWLLSRLKSWSGGWRGASEAAVKLLGGGVSKVEVVSSLVRPGSAIKLAPVVSGLRVLGTPVGGARSVALEDPDRRARVEVKSADGCKAVTVTLGSLAPGSPVPLVALVPLREELEPVLLQLQPAGPREFSARLEGLTAEDYLLLVEPHPHEGSGVYS